MEFVFEGIWEGKEVLCRVRDLQAFINATPDAQVCLYHYNPETEDEVCLGTVPKVQVAWGLVTISEW